jgi:acetyltransferase-like isoleucine patch superfamily enzyme
VRLRPLATFAYRYASPLKILRAIRYPGIRISSGVRLDIRGRFAYGRGCTIGVGANLIVKDGAVLALGRDCALGRYVEVGPDGRIEVGSETSIQDRSILLGDITLGSYCSLAPNVFVSSGRHWFDLEPAELIKDQDRLAAGDERLSAECSRPIAIGDDCWLGANTVVLPGVTIGKGAVVGANSVVAKDVDPYAVVAGAPAKLLKRRLEFDPPRQIEAGRGSDRPYFYSGFEVSRKATRDLAQTGGIAACGRFVIALEDNSGDTLHLIVRAADEVRASLRYAEQQSDVSGSFAEVIFNLAPGTANRLRLHARGENGDATILLQRAWIA